MTRVYGEEDFKTIVIMSSLAVTLTCQRRYREASDLGLKAMASSSRAMGDNHPHTLLAMANLARAKRGLGLNDAAIELMRRSAAASSEVLGVDHPNTKYRHKRVAKWSKEDGAGASDMVRKCT